MALLIYDGTLHLYWGAANSVVSTDLSEVTEAELAVMSDVTCYLTKGGLSEPTGRNWVDAAVACDTFDASAPGTSGGQLSATYRIQDEDGNQVAFDLFKLRADGVLVVVPGDVGSNARIYRCGSHDPTYPTNTANEQQTMTVGYGIYRQNLAAKVSAS